MLNEIYEFDMVYSDAEIVEFISEGRTRVPARSSLFVYEYDLEAMRSFSTFVLTTIGIGAEPMKTIGGTFHYGELNSSTGCRSQNKLLIQTSDTSRPIKSTKKIRWRIFYRNRIDCVKFII